MTDDDLTTALANDVDRAFPDFVDTTQHQLYGGLRMLVADDAGDVAQETYLRAYRALQKYPPQRIRQLKIRSWLWTIALNATHNQRRTQARRPLVLVDRLPDVATGNPERVDEELIEAVRTLPRAQGAAVVLHHVLVYSYPEIALILDRPEGTVKSDASRGLAALRKKGLQT